MVVSKKDEKILQNITKLLLSLETFDKIKTTWRSIIQEKTMSIIETISKQYNLPPRRVDPEKFYYQVGDNKFVIASLFTDRNFLFFKTYENVEVLSGTIVNKTLTDDCIKKLISLQNSIDLWNVYNCLNEDTEENLLNEIAELKQDLSSKIKGKTIILNDILFTFKDRQNNDFSYVANFPMEWYIVTFITGEPFHRLMVNQTKRQFRSELAHLMYDDEEYKTDYHYSNHIFRVICDILQITLDDKLGETEENANTLEIKAFISAYDKHISRFSNHSQSGLTCNLSYI